MLAILGALGAVGLATAAYLFSRWRNRKKQQQLQQQNQQPPDPPDLGLPEGEPDEGEGADSESVSDPGDGEVLGPQVIKLRRKGSVAQITRELEFVQTQDFEEPIESMLPTDEIDIVPVSSPSDLVRVSTSAHAMDDISFYGRLASGALLKRTFQDDPFRKVIVVLSDISGSMKERDRYSWHVELVQSVLDRTIQENASLVLIPFDGYPRDPITAMTIGELEGLYKRVPELLRPDGGTEIDDAIEAGTEYLKSQEITDGNIILITDGDDTVDTHGAKRMLEEAGAELITIGISLEREDLAHISARTYYVQD